MSWECKYCGNKDLYETYVDGKAEYGNYTKDGELMLDNGSKTKHYESVQCENCLAVGWRIERLAEWVDDE